MATGGCGFALNAKSRPRSGSFGDLGAALEHVIRDAARTRQRFAAAGGRPLGWNCGTTDIVTINFSDPKVR